MPRVESPRIDLLRQLAEERDLGEATMSALMDGMEASVAKDGNYFARFGKIYESDYDTRVLVLTAPITENADRENYAFLAVCRGGFRLLRLNGIDTLRHYRDYFQGQALTDNSGIGGYSVNGQDSFGIANESISVTRNVELGYVWQQPAMASNPTVEQCFQDSKKAEAQRLSDLKGLIDTISQQSQLAEELIETVSAS